MADSRLKVTYEDDGQGIVTFTCKEVASMAGVSEIEKQNIKLNFKKILKTAEKIGNLPESDNNKKKLTRVINSEVQKQIELMKSSSSGLGDYMKFNSLNEKIKEKTQLFIEKSENNDNISKGIADIYGGLSDCFDKNFGSLIKVKENSAINYVFKSRERSRSGSETIEVGESLNKENLVKLYKIVVESFSSLGFSPEGILNNLCNYLSDDIELKYSVASYYEEREMRNQLENAMQSTVLDSSKNYKDYWENKWRYTNYELIQEFGDGFVKKIDQYFKSKGYPSENIKFKGKSIIFKKNGELVYKANEYVTTGIREVNFKNSKAKETLVLSNWEFDLSDETKREILKEYKNKIDSFKSDLREVLKGYDIGSELKELEEEIENTKREIGLNVVKEPNKYVYYDIDDFKEYHTAIPEITKEISISSDNISCIKTILEDSTNGVYTYVKNMFSKNGIDGSGEKFKVEMKDSDLDIFSYYKSADTENIDFFRDLNKYYENAFLTLDIKNVAGRSTEEIDEYIKRNMSKNSPADMDSKTQRILEVNNYYDLYNINTPYVRLGFLNKKIAVKNKKGEVTGYNYKYTYIDTVNTPFIKSFDVTDNGARTYNIVLYDRDFNSVLSLDDSSETLETMLIKCLGLNQEGTENYNTASASKDGVSEMYLDEDVFGSVSGFKGNKKVGNLVVEFGYSDYNPKIRTTIGDKKIEEIRSKNSNRTIINGTDYGGAKSSDGSDTRDCRWWETSTEASDSSLVTIKNQVNSLNNSTIRSNKTQCIITGFSTRFTEGGVYYTIKAVEYSDSELSAYKVLQRYSNLTGTPKELMYMVMKLINGLFGWDDYAESFSGDNKFENLKNNSEAKKKLKIIFNNNSEEINIEEPEDILEDGTAEKKVYQISLGSKDAINMYQKDNLSELDKSSDTFLYKSIKTILGSLCSIMPAREEKQSVDVKITDAEGTTENAVSAQTAYRKLTYYYDESSKTIYLYYQRPQKVGSIRRYTWGPANKDKSVVVNVDIKTENEYSLLSSMEYITKEGGLIKKGIVTRDGKFISKPYGKGKCFEDNNKLAAYAVDYIQGNIGTDSETRSKIAMAYSQAMYKGKITILGDPFYNFGRFLQPYAYPIYLDFKLPRSEVGSWGNSMGYSHYMSGLYVVTAIEHSISDNGYYTILDVMSYQNLAKDVLI